MSFSTALHLIASKHGLSVNQKLPNQLDWPWLPVSSQHLLIFSNAGIAGTYSQARPFAWMVEIWTQFLTVAPKIGPLK